MERDTQVEYSGAFSTMYQHDVSAPSPLPDIRHDIEAANPLSMSSEALAAILVGSVSIIVTTAIAVWHVRRRRHVGIHGRPQDLEHGALNVEAERLSQRLTGTDLTGGHKATSGSGPLSVASILAIVVVADCCSRHRHNKARLAGRRI